ncbi:hypothetical protein [Pseudomonas putida]|uniref:hypothetical protein n=1 Tax=Pseudomonas putida TaxID=303 RepID=UPI0039061EC6
MASQRAAARKHKDDSVPNQVFRAREERVADGKRLRAAVPRESHGKWKPARQRNVIALLWGEKRSRELPQ